MKIDKYIFSVLFVVMIVVSTFAAKCYATSHDKIVAIVNEDVITQSEVDSQVAITKQQLAATHAPIPDSAELQHKILEKLIDRTLQLQFAKKSNITVNAADVDKTLQDIAKRNNATMEQMRVELQREGMNYNYYRKQIEDGMLINKLQQAAVGQGITVSEEEAKDFLAKMVRNQPPVKLPDFKAYHVIDVMVHVPDDASKAEKDTAKAKASYLLSRLQRGADLSMLIDEDKSLSSEDLGWRRSSDLPEIFASQVKKMEEGDVAGIIKAPNGLHLIELAGVHDMKPPGLQLSKPSAPTLSEAKEAVYRQKISKKADKWIKSMRASAYVKIINE